MTDGIWGNISLADGQVRYGTIGELHYWLKSRNGEVWIAHGYDADLKEPATEDAAPEHLTWSRWANRDDVQEVQVSPVFADKPLIVNSEYPLKVSPGAKIKIFSRIPVWVRISVADNDYQLIEMPTVKLSRTWFGTPIEGELCYHATTKARRNLAHADKKPYVVSCPITIHNKSDEALDFQHFCFGWNG
ncbi:MAG: DUF432 domain-containing protein [Fodinibius sp.]|nr:DUF432 domain-containing protein [Fodinibius sp.]